MNDLELRARILFVDMKKKFFGNFQAENSKELVEKLLKNLQDIDANMSIKVQFWHNHLDKSPDNCGDVSDEQSNDSIRISKQWKSATRDGGTNEWGLTTARVSKGTYITSNMTDNQKGENFYYSSYVRECLFLFLLLVY